ncbi:MAG: hypothetical protein J3K34DRAFT_443956 [Monoraphidium minutum]|nr:MAG: hypothetical protein J3K34DRAFT_443956 [Monoraphidium minutum]
MVDPARAHLRSPPTPRRRAAGLVASAGARARASAAGARRGRARCFLAAAGPCAPRPGTGSRRPAASAQTPLCKGTGKQRLPPPRGLPRGMRARRLRAARPPGAPTHPTPSAHVLRPPLASAPGTRRRRPCLGPHTTRAGLLSLLTSGQHAEERRAPRHGHPRAGSRRPRRVASLHISSPQD